MSLESLRAKNAARKAARAAAGELPGGQVKATGAKPKRVELAIVREVCPDRGAKLSGQPCGVGLYACNRHGVLTSVGPCLDAKRDCLKCDDHPVRRRRAEMSNSTSAFSAVDSLSSKTQAIVIDHGAGGLGDAVQGMCVVASIKAAHPHTHIVYRAGQRAHRDPMGFVRLFANVADEFGDNARNHSELPVPGAVQMNVGYSGEDLHGKSAGGRSTLWDLPRWERYQRNVGAPGFVIPDLAEPERIASLGADCAGAVGLFPFSTDTSRCWSLHHWLTLESLLIGAGYRTAVFHHVAAGTERFKGVRVIGATPDRVAGAILNCAACVGTDHGLSHLAGVLKRPTVVLGGWFPVRQIYGCYPGFVGIQGELLCDSCCNGKQMNPKSATCRPACANLNSIAPKRVLDAVDESLLPRVAEGSIVDYKRLAAIRAAVLATNHLPGDAAELGVYKGGSARLIRHYGTGMLHLFDTFAGIPADDAHPDGRHVAGEFAGTLDEVRQRVGTGGVAYHVGAFPTGREPADVRYRFVHLDGDTYQTTAAALAYFVPRMVPGGRLILDDFGWENCPGVARAVREAGLKAEKTAEYQAVVRF